MREGISFIWNSYQFIIVTVTIFINASSSPEIIITFNINKRCIKDFFCLCGGGT